MLRDILQLDRRESGKGGGVATFIEHTVKNRVIQVGADHESIVTKLWTDKGKIDVINYYNPCGEHCRTR